MKISLGDMKYYRICMPYVSINTRKDTVIGEDSYSKTDKGFPVDMKIKKNVSPD